MNNGCLILETSDGWKIASWDRQGTARSSDATSAQLSAELANIIQEGGHAGKVVLAPKTNSVLSAPLKNTERNATRLSLDYQFEDALPWSAEEMTADYLPNADGHLGIAVETSRWRPIVDAIENSGPEIQAIVPAAVLKLMHMGAHYSLEAHDVIVCQDERSDVFVLQQGEPIRWYSVANVTEIPVVLMPHLATEEPLAVMWSGSNNEEAAELFPEGTQLTIVEADRGLSCASAASEIIGGKEPLFDLRRGQLAAGDPLRTIRGRLRWCLVAAALFLTSLTIGFLVRSAQLDAHRESLRERQANAYRQVFPQARLPLAIVSRLRSEQGRATGSRSGKVTADMPVPALTLLHRVLESLPPRVRFQLRDIRVENGRVDLEADVRSFADADQIAAALRQAGFEVDPPASVQQSEKIVSSRLFARLSSGNPEKQAARP